MGGCVSQDGKGLAAYPIGRRPASWLSWTLRDAACSWFSSSWRYRTLALEGSTRDFSQSKRAATHQPPPTPGISKKGIRLSALNPGAGTDKEESGLY